MMKKLADENSAQGEQGSNDGQDEAKASRIITRLAGKAHQEYEPTIPGKTDVQAAGERTQATASGVITS